VQAVCTTRAESAEATARRYGVAHALTDVSALSRLADVDLVVVSVRAPQHVDAVRAVLEAGKHVFCEWPLGARRAESELLCDLATQRGARHFVGLQGRFSPALNFIRQLIGEGYLGDQLSVHMFGAFGAWGPVAPPRSDYIYDARNGATLPVIVGGHAIDMLCSLVGEFTRVCGIVANRRTLFTISGDPKTFAKTAPDQMCFVAELADGAPVAVALTAGSCDVDDFTLDLRGARGSLRVKTPYVPEILPPAVFGTQSPSGVLAPLQVPAEFRTAPAALRDGPAVNVYQMFDAVAADLSHASSRAPDFALAARRRALLEAITCSMTSGWQNV
jgi:predicted dehydrogenase